MSRVNDAMRRAGRHEDEPEAVSNDEVFLPGDEGAVEADEEVEPLSDVTAAGVTRVGGAEPPVVSRGELVPQDVPLPAMVPPPLLERSRGDSADEVKIQEVLRILGRHRWMIAGVIAACLAAAIIYNRTAVPQYEAVASVLVEPTPQQTLPFRSTGDDPGRFDYFITQIEVLKSRGLVLKTIEKLEQLPPDQRLTAGEAGAALGSLGISPRRNENGESRVVNIRTRSANPKHAALVANVHAQTYVDQNLINLRQGSREASEWLNARLAELRRDVTSAQSALQAYREQQDAVSLDERSNIVVAKLAQLSTASIDAGNDLIAKRTVYQQLEALDKSGAPLDTLTPIQTNPVLQGIREGIAKLKSERERMSATMLDTHPDMVIMDDNIRSQEQRLKTETANIVQTIKSDYAAAQNREQSLMAELRRQNDEVQELSRKNIGYSSLQRDATSSQQIVDTLMTRLKESELSAELPSNNIRVLDKAEVPGVPVSPTSLLNIVMALVGGTVGGVLLAFGMEFLRPRLLDPQDVASLLGLPLLGTAPRVSKFRRGPADLANVPGSFQEAIRHIRAQIFLSSAAQGLRTLAVTSARPGEGKTVVATSLAISIAMSGRRVLLVDGDLRRANLGSIFGIPTSPGLSNIISAAIKPSAALVETPFKGLYVLPAGDADSNPADLLEGRRLHELIAGLKKVFDVIVIDCPPVMAVADAAIVASAANSVVFVVSAGHTKTELARLAVERLGGVQAHILGVVLNNVKSAFSSDSYAPYYVRSKPVANA